MLPHVEAPAPERETARPHNPPAETTMPESPNLLSRTVTRDLFRAAPDTYAQRFDRLLTPEELGLVFPVAATVWPVSSAPVPYLVQRAGEVHPVPVWPPQSPSVVVVVSPPASSTTTPPTTPAAQLPAVAPPAAPGPPKTIYVIPNCYAGDKRPRRDQLRPGCRMSDLRIISPVL